VFPNNNTVSTNYNGAFCKDMQFSRNYDKEPIVMIAAGHNSEGNNLKPIYMSVTAWIELLSVAIDIHRLNGAKEWIGLNDMDIEGTFVWTNNKTNNFTYWANNQPNDFNNQDCVHTLGVKHSFKWNDVSCGTCYNYTCSEDLDECGGNNNHCHKNAVCTNTLGSYKCQCGTGYTGDGFSCTDIDECSSGHQCDSSATCHNTDGSYTCTCNSGYSGNGRTCRGTNVDECFLNAHDCDSHAICTNTGGSFTCKCDGNANYYGDGKTCSPHRGLDNSVILANDASKLSQLNRWLRPHLRSSDRSYWKLCYRANSHGWGSETFHRKCDNKGPTVTIVEVGSYIFGGYSDKPWKWSSGCQRSTYTFLYSLKNYYGYTPFKKDINNNYQCAIYSYYNYGPTFGAGHDMYISNNANSNSNSYFSTNSYTNPHSSNYVWVGSYNFRPDELEVYYEATA
ncbi:unnamed protein product, partial [Porites evermanni]